MAILSYAYGISNGGPDVSGHAVGKFATLVFFEGRLAAYDLDSTIPGDANPPIDDARLAQLHQGLGIPFHMQVAEQAAGEDQVGMAHLRAQDHPLR